MKNILIVASEGLPFIQTGGLGDVIGALPKSIAKADKNTDVRVVLPMYPKIKKEEMEFVKEISVKLSWRNQYCGIFTCKKDNVTYYFIDNEYYFYRDTCYGQYDDGERFAFFSKAAIDILPEVGFYPDVVHCNDWQTALTVIYLKTMYRDVEWCRNIKTVFTIHNIEYQGKFDPAILGDVFGIAGFDAHIVDYDKCINLMKGAIECSDSVTTVSPSYAGEIFNPFFSHGLTPIIEKNSYKLTGILNGIDVDFYNPSIDKALYKKYNIKSIQDKSVNKVQLQKHFCLPENANIPMISIISRLVSHKGMDITCGAVDDILQNNVQLVVLGTGDKKYEDFFKGLQHRYPSKVISYIAFEPEMARKIYAASDIFLMPSKSEPCGLAQMICSRYGTVPIVRETGGLKDSIRDCTLGEGNGFTFVDYTSANIVNAVNRALSVYHNKKNWENLMREVMSVDFSWNVSAQKYLELYRGL